MISRLFTMSRRLLPLLWVGTAGCWLWSGPEGSIVDVHALSDEEAVLVVRGESTSWLIRTRQDGSEVWRRELPVQEASPSALAVEEGTGLLWMDPDDGHPAHLAAVDLDAGTVLWEAEDARGSAGRPDLWVDGEGVIVLDDDEGLVERSLQTGAIRWTHPLPPNVLEVRVGPEAVLYRAVGKWVRVPRGEGSEERDGASLDVQGHVCWDAGGTEGYRVAQATLRRVVGTEVEDTGIAVPMAFSQSCGQRGGDLVLSGPPPGGGLGELVLLRVDPESGDVRWKETWAEAGDFAEIVAHPGEGAPLGGALDPVELVRLMVTDVPLRQLRLVDLETGQTRWEGTAVQDLHVGQIVSHPSGVVLAETQGEIAVLDPDGPDVVAAVHNVFGAEPGQVSDGAVSIYEKSRAPLDELPFHVLELPTLAKVGGVSGSAPDGALETARRHLGFSGE